MATPAALRRAVERRRIPNAWQRCEVVNKAEQESLKSILKNWGAR